MKKLLMVLVGVILASGALIASEPIQFDFDPIDEQNSFFCLKVLI